MTPAVVTPTSSLSFSKASCNIGFQYTVRHAASAGFVSCAGCRGGGGLFLGVAFSARAQQSLRPDSRRERLSVAGALRHRGRGGAGRAEEGSGFGGSRRSSGCGGQYLCLLDAEVHRGAGGGEARRRHPVGIRAHYVWRL